MDRYSLIFASIVLTAGILFSITARAEDCPSVTEDWMPGSTYEYEYSFTNDGKGDSEYVDYYLVPVTDDYDPRKVKSKVQLLDEEYNRLFDEIQKAEQKGENTSELYDEINSVVCESDRHPFDPPREYQEESVEATLNKIQLKVQGSNGVSFDSEKNAEDFPCEMVRLAKLYPEESDTILVTMKIPEDMSETEIEQLKTLTWEIVRVERNEHPAFSVEVTILNEPENGEYFVPMVILEDHNPAPEDNAVNYEVTVTNVGNVPVKAMTVTEDVTAFGGMALQPGQSAWYGGWHAVSNEDAEKGEGVIKVVVETELDNPDIKEHLIVEGTASYPAGHKQEVVDNRTEETEKETSAQNEAQNDGETESHNPEIRWIIIMVSGIIVVIGLFGITLHLIRKRKAG